MNVLLISAGQSNSPPVEYTKQRVVTNAIYSSLAGVYWWRWGCTPNQNAQQHKRGVWQPIGTKGCYPFTYGDLTLSRESPGWAIPACKTIKDAGHNVAMITANQPGTSLAADWRASESSGYKLYARLVREVQAAPASQYAPAPAKAPTKVFFIWYQGEADANDVVQKASYGTNLAAFMSALRTDLSMPNLHVIICRTSTQSGQYGADVAAAQDAWVAGDAHASIVATESYEHIEPHLTNVGATAFGTTGIGPAILSLLP